MKTKDKFEESLEQLTQLRIELLKDGNKKTEETVSEIEMTICEGIDLLNIVDLANVRLSFKLLKIAKCPNCDGSGAMAHGNPQDPDWEQCQWCDERNRLVGNEA